MSDREPRPDAVDLDTATVVEHKTAVDGWEEFEPVDVTGMLVSIMARQQARSDDPKDKIPTPERVTCTCQKCRSLCSSGYPGFGTVAEIQRLIDDGLGGQMSLCTLYGDDDTTPDAVEYVRPANAGWERTRGDFSGACSFLYNGVLCAIHDKKPVECAVVKGCGDNFGDPSGHAYDIWRAQTIRAEWNTDAGRALVEKWKADFGYDYERGLTNYLRSKGAKFTL